MNELTDDDNEIENLALAQEDLIKLADRLAQRTTLKIWQDAFCHQFGIGNPTPRLRPNASLAEDRELLLWRIQKSPNLAESCKILPKLFRNQRFLSSLPENTPCVLLQSQNKRPWNEAASLWGKKEKPKKGEETTVKNVEDDIWLQYERQLELLLKDNQIIMQAKRNELIVCFDAQNNQLQPKKLEETLVIAPDDVRHLGYLFSEITPKILYTILKAPLKNAKQPKAQYQSSDSYIAKGPLRVNLNEIIQGKSPKNNEDKQFEDLGKGVASWLTSLMKSSR